MSRKTTSRKTTSRRTTLRHTEADIEIVDRYGLVAGNTYMIQHNNEGLKGINSRNKSITTEQINDFNTRFRGKFVKYDIGKSPSYPDGIPGITSSREVAVFENVKIISKDKTDLTDDIYVLFPVKSRQGMPATTRGKSWVDVSLDNHMSDEKAIEHLLSGIRRNYTVAFAVNTWTFAKSSLDLQDEISNKALGFIADAPVNPNDPIELQRLTSLQKRVTNEGLMGEKIARYLGNNISVPAHRYTNRGTLTGSKRTIDDKADDKADDEADDEDIDDKKVEGGRKRRTRRNKRSKTRKSRKGKSRKSRRHYRK